MKQQTMRRRRAGSPTTALVTALLCTMLTIDGSPAGAAETRWSQAGKTRGVPLESGTAAAGYRMYRGTVDVCTSLMELRRFVGDASRLDEWIPYTEEARALPDQGSATLYYLRTSAPWPFKSRDMVYRLTPEPASGKAGAIRLDLAGVPDAVPEQPGVVRMTAAEGKWTLMPLNGRIEVTLQLGVDPGRVPGFLTQRRLATTVGGTLANLAAAFPCERDRPGSDAWRPVDSEG